MTESRDMAAFGEATRTWFLGAFEQPTRAQREAWEAIATGSHTLVVAPTGSGKTLAAFLWALDRLIHDTEVATEPRKPGTRILYISPLKALGVDVERNLNAPLVGIDQTAKRLGLPANAISVGVRSGDTKPAERRRLQANPPDVLITTPESLYLMLTSSAREGLRAVDTVIVDEVHALADSKRGTHLALSLERLDALLTSPAQRIGLSATVRPLETVAKFLGGAAPVKIVAPPSEKAFDLKVVVPVEDLSDLGTVGGPGRSARDEGASQNQHAQDDDIVFGDSTQSTDPRHGSIWPHIEAEIVDRVLEHRSTIVFVNSRGLAERLTANLNEEYRSRLAEAAAQAEFAAATDSNSNADSAAATDSRATADSNSASAASHGPEASLRGEASPRRHANPQTDGAPHDEDTLARTHHGSMSKTTRAAVEEALKSGELRCVVATSSLELGIDMGDVELVIQVEAPPSVASGLQRLGRAGHQVGGTSRGVMLPKHRADVLNSAVVAARMLSGTIERIELIENPLDVLAQQIIAASAVDAWAVDDWLALARKASSYQRLSRALLDSVLDLLAGRYPSDEFAHLRPRIVWDRDADTFTGRPGAQRLAVTGGGTIPDRGMYGVFMYTGAEDGPESEDGTTASSRRPAGTRVGELDEEMVYESRVGDVIALGSTSWRIREIGPDRVRVTPAFGQPGRLPFWHGDSIGRPAELGAAIGEMSRAIATKDAVPEGLEEVLDEHAATNLVAYIREQGEATGQVPSDRVLVVERNRDELGDWRVVLHSPFGRRVHAPWALLVTARVRERFGMEGSAVASDDGIVVRIPDIDADPPGAELFVFEREEIKPTVTREVGASALFAARFRENAARALLLPRLHPGKRSPLWQQRLRAAQLLEVARRYPEFPIILETVREVLNDVYDLEAFTELIARIESREVRITEVVTPEPSPFARNLLFGYVGQFLYEGDQPLAERRAAALNLDANLLSELLGATSLRELLDQDAIDDVAAELQKRAPGFRARDLEGVADLLRLLGPLSETEILERFGEDAGLMDSAESASPEGSEASASDPSRLAEVQAAMPGIARLEEVQETVTRLVDSKRALRLRIAGTECVAAIEDAARLRDALGTPIPIGVPAAFLAPVEDPLGDLVARFARTNPPFTTAEVAERLGIGQSVALAALQQLELSHRIVRGEFTPARVGEEWVDDRVLRRIRARTLAKLRHEVEPVSQAAYARFLTEWQQLDGDLRGVDGVFTVIDQLQGAQIPASAWESLILPARVRDYSPGMLDELIISGEVRWHGHSEIGRADGWLSLHLSDTEHLTFERPELPEDASPLAKRVAAVLARGGAMFLPQIVTELTVQTGLGPASAPPSLEEIADALWELAWFGIASSDSLVPLRALLAGQVGARSSSSRSAPSHRTARQPARGRSFRSWAAERKAAQVPPRAAGRWSLAESFAEDATVKAQAGAELQLDRYGVVTRGSVEATGIEGGFALAYRVLAKFEEAGRARRGYFIAGLGAAQFATAGAIDALRRADDDRFEEKPPLRAVTLAATDPANPYGAALPWPEHESTHRPGRKAGGLVTLVDGELMLYVERGGKTLLSFLESDSFENNPVARAAAESLAETVRRARIPNLVIEKINGAYALEAPLARLLTDAGFGQIPRGLRMRL
ncbi:Lhr family ATP-dependent helicase [Gulosibacter chungangensis]|uniref:DEAD/DEAH box helicase n=1 Tax=Gulosibacter chungangensis TaxID=979746 RepID=A0A7J5BH17_9MICO|nr:DEAD/DEAH box helicase [Gulosibacter chungangensis]KAB1644920.1 DEAD/DEAH box helicase [Gulosibacter chungangensis]